LEVEQGASFCRWFQARCTNLHGCGLQGPRATDLEYAIDRADELRLYVLRGSVDFVAQVTNVEGRAKKKTDGHLQIMRFTSGWKAFYGTILCGGEKEMNFVGGLDCLHDIWEVFEYLERYGRKAP
jgi:hypothetical protein